MVPPSRRARFSSFLVAKIFWRETSKFLQLGSGMTQGEGTAHIYYSSRYLISNQYSATIFRVEPTFLETYPKWLAGYRKMLIFEKTVGHRALIDAVKRSWRAALRSRRKISPTI